MAEPLLVNFIAGRDGAWAITAMTVLAGDALPVAEALDVIERPLSDMASGDAWTLRGSTGHLRYTTRDEVTALGALQAPLARASSACAALIPIRKTAAWWDLAQDERRAIMEERSRHIRIGLDFLPAIARRLHHCREFGEPFDFLTWFEFAPEHQARFDDLLGELRATEEWDYVDREIDIRLVRKASQTS
jgi:hypothetical protein